MENTLSVTVQQAQDKETEAPNLLWLIGSVEARIQI